MMAGKSCLDELEPGQKGRISSIQAKGDIRRRLLDLGAAAGTEVSCVGLDASGDAGIYRVRNALMVIRKAEAGKIRLEKDEQSRSKVIVLAGHPNVGKSTIFNGLTGGRQHTGNWAGKTVRIAAAKCRYAGHSYTLVDMPGCYSLMARSTAETEARDYLCFRAPDTAVVVCEACCLERSMALVLQVIEAVPETVVCVNMIDEAVKAGVQINIDKLEQQLGVPVVATTARRRSDLHKLMKCIEESQSAPANPSYRITYPEYIEAAVTELEEELHKATGRSGNMRWCCCRLLDGDEDFCRALLHYLAIPYDRVLGFLRRIIAVRGELGRIARQQKGDWQEDMRAAFSDHAKRICAAVREDQAAPCDRSVDRGDRLFTGSYGAIALVLLAAFVFWLTIVGAGHLSPWLGSVLVKLGKILTTGLTDQGMAEAGVEFLVSGIYRPIAWVMTVLLPPMIIFFPLFKLLEDFGFLPRMALILERSLGKCSSCPRQALAMCVGFGGNADGISAGRMIGPVRERLITMLTGSFIPGSDRILALIVLTSLLFAGTAVGSLRAVAILLIALGGGLVLAFAVSELLAQMILPGKTAQEILELPPYRRPQVSKALAYSFGQRIRAALGRALPAAIAAGILLWVLASAESGGQSLLLHCKTWLDPLADALGLDGFILLAFILSFPAGEIFIPVLLIIYLVQGQMPASVAPEMIRELLVQHGWTAKTALLTTVFGTIHWPSLPVCQALYRETKSWKWTLTGVLIPTVTGMGLCYLINQILLLMS